MEKVHVPIKFKESYNELSELLSGKHLIASFYNDDKGDYSSLLASLSYTSIINVSKDALAIYNKVIEHFTENIYNKEEQIALLEIIDKRVKSFASKYLNYLVKRKRATESMIKDHSFMKDYSEEKLKSYLIELEKTEQQLIQIKNIVNEKLNNYYLSLLKSDISENKKNHLTPPIKSSQNLTFGYKGDVNNLLSVVSKLDQYISLLKHQFTTAEQLVKVLTAKDLSSDLAPIYFDVETTQIRLLFVNLKPFFNNLTFANIEKSKLFYSSLGNPIKAQNLSSSKIHSPKNETTINSILRELL